MNLTDSFIEYITSKCTDPIPEKVWEKAQDCLLDYMGAVTAGAFAAGSKLTPYIDSLSSGEASIIGSDKKTFYAEAAFTNAYFAHYLELDDGHRKAMIHLAAPIISSVLAAGQMKHAAGEELLRGIIAGYEAAVRLAIGMNPNHKMRGFHTSGTCGTIGAAVGAGYVLGLTGQQLKTAITAAATGASGLLEIQEENSEMKPYNVAQAAMNGWNAALFGLTGLNTDDDILGGKRGFVNILSEDADKSSMIRPEEYYEIERIYTKPYASCRHSHPAIDAALTIMKQNRLTADRIADIRISIYKHALPGHDHKTICGMTSAKLSIPYSVAAACVLGDCGIPAFSQDNMESPVIRKLMDSIELQENPEYTEQFPSRRIADAVIHDTEGNTYSSIAEFAKGEPENPLTDSELHMKFKGLFAYSRNTHADEVIQAVRNIRNDAEGFYGII